MGRRRRRTLRQATNCAGKRLPFLFSFLFSFPRLKQIAFLKAFQSFRFSPPAGGPDAEIRRSREQSDRLLVMLSEFSIFASKRQARRRDSTLVSRLLARTHRACRWSR